MTNLNLSASIEEQFLKIVDEAVASKVLNPQKVRMLAVTPTEDASALDVYAVEEYDDFLYLEHLDDGPIGRVDISGWLDAADQLVLESALKSPDPEGQQSLRTSGRVGPGSRFTKVKPALPLSFLDEEGAASLRDSLLEQVETGLGKAAVLLDGRFTHVVPVVTKELVYQNGDNNQTVAFCHKLGQGPFYPAMLSLPDTVLTYPFLKMLPEGFALFYPQGDIHDDDEKSSVFICEMNSVKYARIDHKDKDFYFRMDDRFEDWRIDGGHIHEEYGDPSEEELISALDEMLSRFPDKKQDLDRLPNPLSESEAFAQWVEEMVKHNLYPTFKQREQLYLYGEEAYRKALEIIPDTYQHKIDFIKRWAYRALESGEYASALKEFQTIKGLPDAYNSELLYLLYVQKEDGQFEAKLDEIKAQGTLHDEVRLPVWLKDIRDAGDDTAKLESILDDVKKFVADKEGYRTKHVGLFVQALLELRLGNAKTGLDTFLQINLGRYFLGDIAETEFSSYPQVAKVLAMQTAAKKEAERTEKELDQGAFTALTLDRVGHVDKAISDSQFVCTKSISNEVDLKWARFVSPERLVVFDKERTLRLLGVEFDSGNLSELDAIRFEKKDASYEFCLDGSVLFP